MTHLLGWRRHAAAVIPAQPTGAASPARRHPFCGGAMLTLQIESRRMRLAELEAEMVAACEVAALGGHPR